MKSQFLIGSGNVGEKGRYFPEKETSNELDCSLGLVFLGRSGWDNRCSKIDFLMKFLDVSAWLCLEKLKKHSFLFKRLDLPKNITNKKYEKNPFTRAL